MGADDEVLPGQTAIDDADQAAGYRQVVDDGEAADLAPDDPNIAASVGDHDHHNHIGDEADDDAGVAAAGAEPSHGRPG